MDFARCKTLARYLAAIDIRPRIQSVPSTMRKGGAGWLNFPMRGGAYSPESMVDALAEVVQAKIREYVARPPGMDEFHLLVHYDQAWEYNSPVLGIDFGYAEAVQVVASRIGTRVGVFDRILVFVPIIQGQRVFQLYP